jgi:hypothetical protein
LPKPRKKTASSKPRKRPFRGPTPKKVFQTVDVGSGLGEYVLGRTRRFPRRKYVAVEYQYGPEGKFDSVKNVYPKVLKKKGVRVFGGYFHEFAREMVEKGLKTRHISVIMPYPSVGIEYSSFVLNLGRIIEWAPRILLPNGKIFLLTEKETVRNWMELMARNFGMKTRRLRTLRDPREKQDTETLQNFSGEPVYRLEITQGLKKAVPDKSKRRKWPE